MRLTIKTRLIAAFVLLLGLSGIIYMMADQNAGKLNNSLNDIINSNSKRLIYVGKISADMQVIATRTREIVLSGDKNFIDENRALVEQKQKEVDRNIEELLRLQNEQAAAITQEFIELREEHSKVFKKIISQKLIDSEESDQEAARLSLEECRPLVLKFGKTLDKLVRLNEKSLEQAKEETDKLYAEMKSDMIMLMVLGVLLAGAIAIWIIYSISVSINKAKNAIQAVAEGDLTIKIAADNKDEIGELLMYLSSMVEKIKEVISSVTSAADNIAAASQQMSSSSQQMSEGATEQAASAEEVSSSMEEMAANIQQNTDNAQETEKIAFRAAEDVQEGSKAVNQTVDSMKKIAEKIGIIGEIARQTNLLALNAAVEAARAGEHGKGFAVVAAEVRKLAERSQLAANEINELSSSSVAIADKSGKLLEQIVPNIQKTSRLVQEISASSTEQNAGAEQVNNAIQQLNQVIQQNAAGAEEMASSSEELSSQADQLKETVLFFNVGNATGRNTAAKAKKKKVAVAHLNSNVKIKRPGVHQTGLNLDLQSNDSLDAEFERY